MSLTTLPAPEVESNGTATKPVPVDLSKPVISGGGYWGVPSVNETLLRLGRQLQWKYGDELYEWMRKDPIAGGSVKVLRSFTLASPLQLIPNRRPGAGQTIDDPKLQEQYDISAQIADFCQWVLEKMDRPVDEVNREFCESSWSYGAQLADIVWRSVPRGDYEGPLPPVGLQLQTIEGMDHKSRRSWEFMVQPIRKIPRAIRGVTKGESRLYPIDKFAIGIWEPSADNPAGSSIYDMAIDAWIRRVNIWEEAYKFCQRFGTPAPYAYLDNPNNEDIYAPQQKYGGKSMADYFLDGLLAWRNGQAFVGRKGDVIGLMESGGDGSGLWSMIDKTRIEIVLAILFQAGATQETQYGNRAKSETSMDVLGNILRYMKRWNTRLWEWQVLYRIVWFNFGRRFADLYTPIASLGDTDAGDTAGLLKALATVGYRLTPSQLPELDAMAGMPIRQSGEEIIPSTGTVAAPVDDNQDGKAAA